MLIETRICELFTRLSSKVVHALLFSCGTRELFGNDNLFGTVECTAKLSKSGCHRCLSISLDELLIYSYGMRGGHVIYGSCYIRFEFYKFF
ncbi:unnamed protein product [Prunus brigantina]